VLTELVRMRIGRVYARHKNECHGEDRDADAAGSLPRR
jgi:hypothetical protein